MRIPTDSYAQVTVNFWNSPANSNDANYAVAVRGSYVYSAGATRNSSNNLDLILIRWSITTGAFKWAKRYAGAAKMDDAATDVVIDSKGNAIVCGTTENAAGYRSWVVRKYNRSGDKLWTRTYDGSALHDDSPLEMVVDGANNIYVTGYTRQDTVTGVFTVKLSPSGGKLWTRKYRGPDGNGGSATAIVRRPAGGVYVGGYTDTDACAQEGLLLHYTGAGDRKVYELWNQNHLQPSDQTINDIAVASTGQIIGVGEDHGNPGRVHWNTAGGLDYSYTVDTDGLDWWQGVGTDAYGGVYLTGPFDNDSVNPNIRTWRSTLLSQGGQWLYDYDDNGYNREVNAIAVSGLSCAVVGRQYNGTDYDQYVHIWQY